jgi:Tfp pilus assembly protein PilZ
MSRNLIKITRQDGTQIEKPSNIFDLSEGGLRIVCYENFPIGTPLNIELLIAEDVESLKMGANIVWIRPMKDSPGAWFAGVQFADLSEETRIKLRAIVQRHLGPS